MGTGCKYLHSGLGTAHWTAQELVGEVVKRGIIASISASQVRRYLRESVLAPPTSGSRHERTGKARRHLTTMLFQTTN
jgi:hypothetical protein